VEVHFDGRVSQVSVTILADKTHPANIDVGHQRLIKLNNNWVLNWIILIIIFNMVILQNSISVTIFLDEYITIHNPSHNPKTLITPNNLTS